MKKSIKAEYKKKSSNELQKESSVLRAKLWQSTLDLKAGKVKNVQTLKELRRSIAHIETVRRANTI